MNKTDACPIRSRLLLVRAGNGSKGFTLIELLLVLALTSSLLGGTIGVISIARGSDQQSKNSLLKRQEIRRFADDIRRDVRLASDVQLSQNSNLNDDELVLSNASLDWQIVYQVESDTSVSRRVEKTNASTTLRDNYTIGNSASIDVQWLDEINAVHWTITEMDRPDQPIHIIASQRSSQ